MPFQLESRTDDISTCQNPILIDSIDLQITHLYFDFRVSIAVHIGSMQSRLKPPQGNAFASTQSRWEELLSMTIIISEIATFFDSDGLDLYFLNRGMVKGVKDIQSVQQAFAAPPEGFVDYRLNTAALNAEKLKIWSLKRNLEIE